MERLVEGGQGRSAEECEYAAVIVTLALVVALAVVVGAVLYCAWS